METAHQPRRSDLAPDTLLVASIGSATATVVIGRFGLAGTLLGAALFPVVLALAKELARRPTRRLPQTVRRRSRSGTGSEAVDSQEPPERQERAAFGERWREIRWRRVLATAAVAFAAVVAAFTLAELAFGGSLVSDRPTTFFTPGAQVPPADDPGAPLPAGPEEEEQPVPEEPAEPAEEAPLEPPTPEEEPPAGEPPAEEAP